MKSYLAVSARFEHLSALRDASRIVSIDMADAALLERLIAEDPSFFAELLTQLANTEATPRNQAETAFNSLKERYPEALVIKLLFFVQTGPTPIVRSFSATLLRRVRHPFTSLCDDLVIEGAHQRTTFTVDKCRAESSGPDQLFVRSSA